VWITLVLPVEMGGLVFLAPAFAVSIGRDWRL
jgi:hypothetical protein